MSVLHDATRRSRLASGWGQLELPLMPRASATRPCAAPPSALLARPLRPRAVAAADPAAPSAPEGAPDGR
jgi:hypothetical protein